MPLAFTIILPLVGTLGTLGLSLVSRFRSYARYVALAAVGSTAILILAFRWLDPAMVILSLWEPVSLFGATLILQNDVIVQPLAFALALVACSAVLVIFGRADEPHPRLVATMLTLLAAGFVSLWAANPLTMIAGWAVYDLLQAGGHIVAGGSARTAIRGLVVGNVATVLLWVGTALSHGGASSELWSLMTPSKTQLALWAVAGLLRLWAYPFHLAAPDDLDTTSPITVLLFLIGPVTGWGLWLRLASANGGSIADGAWLPTIAAVTLAMGGFLAWSSATTRSALPWIGMGATGAVLLTAQLTSVGAIAIISAGSVTWVLGIATLFLSDGLQRKEPWWSLPSLLGAWALMGVPLTLGFVVQAPLVRELTRSGHLEWGIAFFIGNIFLIPALVRWLLLPVSSSFPSQRWLLAARGIGAGLPALLLIVAGLYPPLLAGGTRSFSISQLFTTPGLVGWLLWMASLAGGGVLAWQDRNLRPQISLLLGAAHDLLCLDWFYDALVGALDRGLSVLRAADEMVGGAGALLWSWLLFLIVLLAWGGK